MENEKENLVNLTLELDDAESVVSGPEFWNDIGNFLPEDVKGVEFYIVDSKTGKTELVEYNCFLLDNKRTMKVVLVKYGD